jgi:putative thioredoxin
MLTWRAVGPCNGRMPAAPAFDVTAVNFQAEVVEASLRTPVLLDFWAGWCGPCRTLGPLLERLVIEYGGAFRLGKVDTDREMELAAAFQVQGIPFCVLIARGRPVDTFTGALREAEVRRFLSRHGIEPAKAEPQQPATPDPDSPAGRLQKALAAAAAGDAGAARAALEGFPEEDERFDRVANLRAGLGFLEQPLAAQAPGAAGALAAARAAFLARDYETAMERALDAARIDRDFGDGLARRAMVLCFLVLGEDDERCDQYRRRLATLLY